ncbi:cytochrome P450 3A19-like [Pleurodeles waltl]|uniref:cytochrome P450 3A19-like n=1 Tax=Pleurodeles waltl TaxID=8319 RepID=UPI00370990F1
MARAQQAAPYDLETIAQIIISILAGYETTSTALSFLSYNLATHPDVPWKLQQEIDTLLPNKAPPSYDALMQMEYLEMAINKTLGMHPPGGQLERICKKTVEVNGVTISEGVIVMIPLYLIHWDPEYWSDLDEFNPDRYHSHMKGARPYTFLPFGSVPRNCIGMRFALLSLKIPLELDTRGLIKNKTPIYLKLVTRTPELVEDK